MQDFNKKSQKTSPARKDTDELTQELFRAIRENNRQRMDDMLEAGADLAGRDANGRTPLQAAVDNRANACVHLLLIRGADPDALSQLDGLAPLHRASWNGWDGIVRMLLQHGAEVNIKSRDGSTALHYAVAAAHDDVAQLLLDYRIDAGQPDRFGETPARMADDSGHDNLARRIREHISHWHSRRVKALRGRPKGLNPA